MSLIINKQELLRAAPIKRMATDKIVMNGMSYGLGEAGYDIRIKQEIRFNPGEYVYLPEVQSHVRTATNLSVDGIDAEHDCFCLASAIEEFDMPADMVGMVYDKSSWARQGLSLFNTVIEPGWRGFLTLELVFHGNKEVIIPAGSPIAQVIFHNTVHAAAYNGKYQNQADQPVAAIHE